MISEEEWLEREKRETTQLKDDRRRASSSSFSVRSSFSSPFLGSLSLSYSGSARVGDVNFSALLGFGRERKSKRAVGKRRRKKDESSLSFFEKKNEMSASAAPDARAVRLLREVVGCEPDNLPPYNVSRETSCSRAGACS
jgi:hypothetical protein